MGEVGNAVGSSLRGFSPEEDSSGKQGGAAFRDTLASNPSRHYVVSAFRSQSLGFRGHDSSAGRTSGASSLQASSLPAPRSPPSFFLSALMSGAPLGC